MQFFYTLTSPYARKCHIILHINGLIEQTELVITDQFAEDFRQINPLGKIPSLRTEDLILMDSPLICEYLDDKGQSDLFKKGSAQYYHIQQAHVLANGIIDAAVATVYEKRRDSEPSQKWLTRWNETLHSSLSQLSTQHLGSPTDINIASVAMVTALAYLDFRLSELPWREWNPTVADWYNPFTELTWFDRTQPQ